MIFFEERFFTKVKSFFDSVLKNKLLTFANKIKNETSTSGKDKVTAGIMESVGLAAIIEILEKSGLVKLSGIQAFYKQHFYKERQAKIGKRSSKF